MRQIAWHPFPVAIMLMLAGQANAQADTSGPIASTTMGVFKPVPPGPHVPMPKGNWREASVTLVRGFCYGSCPAYSVTIHGDGRIDYEGRGHVRARGKQSASIDPKLARTLFRQFAAADFWSLAPQYAAPVTDAPPYFLSMTIGGETKQVMDYVGHLVGMPAVVRELEGSIDTLAGTSRWIGDPAAAPR